MVNREKKTPFVTHYVNYMVFNWFFLQMLYLKKINQKLDQVSGKKKKPMQVTPQARRKAEIAAWPATETAKTRSGLISPQDPNPTSLCNRWETEMGVDKLPQPTSSQAVTREPKAKPKGKPKPGPEALGCFTVISQKL